MKNETKIVKIIKDAIHKAMAKSEQIKNTTRSKVKEALIKSKPARETLEEVAGDTLKGFTVAAKDAQIIANKAAKKIISVMKEVKENTSVLTASTLKGVKKGVQEIQQRNTKKIATPKSENKPKVSIKGSGSAKRTVKKAVRKPLKKTAVKKTVKKVVKKSGKKIVNKSGKKTAKK